MAQISIPKNYADDQGYFESNVDDLKDSVEAFFNTTRISDDNLQDSGINAATKFIDSSVSSDKLASGSITTPKITDDNVTFGKKEVRSVSTDGSDPGRGGLSQSTALTGSFTVESGDGRTTVTTLSTSLTAKSGSIIMLALIPQLSDGYIRLTSDQDGNDANQYAAEFYFVETHNSTSTDIFLQELRMSEELSIAGTDAPEVSHPPGGFWCLYYPTEDATYTFTVDADATIGSNPKIIFNNLRLIAYEI